MGETPGKVYGTCGGSSTVYFRLQIRSKPTIFSSPKTGHVSEKSSKDWRKLSETVGFKVETVKRGSVLYGGPFFDRHPALFGLILIFDSFADLFHTYGLSWDIILKLRKEANSEQAEDGEA